MCVLCLMLCARFGLRGSEHNCCRRKKVREKKNDRGTAAKCQQFGLKLVPMVVESFGGWGLQAQEAFKVIAGELASQQGSSFGKTLDHMYQGLSIKLMQANARSLLTRVADAGSEGLGPRSAT